MKIDPKDWQIVQKILKVEPAYEFMTKEQKAKFHELLSRTKRDVLGLVLDEIPASQVDTYQAFYDIVESYYISTMARNSLQEKFLHEALTYQRDNYRNQITKKEVTTDTYNEGKHTDKFSKRHSTSQNKAKRKAFARVRKMTICFS